MKTKTFDLTLTIKDGMTTFPVPWHPKVEISTQGRIGIEKREVKKSFLVLTLVPTLMLQNIL